MLPLDWCGEFDGLPSPEQHGEGLLQFRASQSGTETVVHPEREGHVVTRIRA